MLQAQDGGHAYLELFRLVNAQPAYDEVQIRKQLGKHFKGNFKKLKHATFQNILRGLERYFAGSTDEILVLRKLIQAEILFDKKLFSAARKNIQGAIDLAEKKDLLFFKLHCYEWSYRLAVAAAQPQEAIRAIGTDKMKKAVQDCGRWLELKHLNALFWNFIHTSAETATHEEKKLLSHIIVETKGILKQASAGFTISKDAYSLLALALRFNGKLEESYSYRLKLASLIETDKVLVYERAYSYISALGMLVNISRELGKYDDMKVAYEKAKQFMEQLPRKYFNLRLDESSCNVFNNYITGLFVNQNYDQVIVQGEELMARIKKHSAVFQNSLLSILYQSLMYSYFYRKNYKVAMKYHHLHIKTHPLDEQKNKKDYIFRKLFGLVILFEMGDRDALHYQCRTLSYYMKKNKEQHAAEILLVKAFGGTLQKKYSQREMQSDFSSLLLDMTKEKERFDQIRKAHKFDYLAWVSSKAATK